jgi:hypothetical protein
MERGRAVSDDRIEVERVGGFGGFGLPASHLKSRGEISTSQLSPADLQAVEALFTGPPHAGAPLPDSFSYRLSRNVGGEAQTIVVPEESVPMAIRNCVKDVLE